MDLKFAAGLWNSKLGKHQMPISIVEFSKELATATSRLMRWVTIFKPLVFINVDVSMTQFGSDGLGRTYKVLKVMKNPEAA